MKKDQIIQNLYKQNEQLKREVQEWKAKYLLMEKAYEQLLSNSQSAQLNVQNRQISKQTLTSQQKQDPGKLIAGQDKQIVELLGEKQQQTFIYQYFLPSISSTQQVEPILQQKQARNVTQKNVNKQIKANQFDVFDFFQEENKKQNKLSSNNCELTEGCFILQKLSSIDHFDPLRFIYPSQKFNKIRSMLDIVYRYVFVNEEIPQIEDDEYQSRRNEIVFGAPCQDFQFVFDNVGQGKGQKNRLNDFQKMTHLIRRRYVYGVVRTQIMTIQNRSFQTELAYGFISSLPFPNFFKDLNRIVHQQLKYRMLNIKRDEVNKTQKIDIISQVLKDFTAKSLQKSLCVQSYPINLQLKANVCALRLVYNSKSNYVSDIINYIEPMIYKYSLLKLIKIFHYALTQKHMVIVCKNRKSLNQIFQVIRCLLYPFNWLFPIIYYYSPFFQPFLSSPMPIMIGFIQNEQKKMPQNDFITIFAEDEGKQDLNEPKQFTRRINKCHKQFSKGLQQPKDLNKSSISPLLNKSAQDRMAYKFYYYTKVLRQFIETGSIKEELDSFYLQFMQTQLASYYRQNSMSQDTKQTKSSPKKS